MKTGTIYRLTGVAIISLLSIGCETIDSDDIRTSGIYANIDLTAKGDGNTGVVAVFKTGGAFSNTYVDFSSGDVLTVTDGSTTKTLSKNKSLFGPIEYKATIANDTANTPFSISLTRFDNEDAPSSNVTLPGGFTITSDVGSAPKSRSNDAIDISWTSEDTTDSIGISFSGDCIESYSLVSPDNGSYTVNAGVFIQMTGEGIANECDVTMTMEKQRSGQVDSAFDSGSINAVQTRKLVFLSTP